MTHYELDLTKRTFRKYPTIDEIFAEDYTERIYFTSTQREDIIKSARFAEKRKEAAREKLGDLCTVLNNIALKKMQGQNQ